MKDNYMKNITAASLERYLLLNEWVRNYDFSNKNMMVFELGDELLAFPASEMFADFYIGLPNVLETLAYLSGKSIRDITREIVASYHDLLEFRIMSEHSENGQLPLDYASECISGIKELILYAACAEQLIQPVCFRITNNAKCILNDFKLAQTEMGSFVINIDIQVADEAEQYTIDGVEGENGRGHLVVQRIGQAIKQIDEMTKNRSAFKELVSNAYESGATANICEALMRLKPDSSSAEIETTIRYASACGKKTADVVKMGSGHFNTMGEISKHYREKESQILAEVEGYITSLVKKKVDEIHAERVIRTIVGINGEMRTVIAELCEEDYRMACDAHRDGEKIYIRGILDMSKKMYRFINVDQFKIILA